MSDSLATERTPREEFEHFFIDFLSRRERQMGSDAGGLHGFYLNRLRAGRALNRYEAILADLLVEQLPRYEAYVEIGAGLAQLPCLLSIRGLRTVAVEKDDSRYAGLQALRAEVVQRWPHVEGLMSAVSGAFPCQIPDINPDRSVILSTNLVYGASYEIEQGIIAGISRYGAAIVDSVRFCRDRIKPAEWEALDARFAAAGLTRQQLLWVFGDEGEDYQERYMWYSRER